MSSSLRDVLATMVLERAGDWSFVGQQLPAPANHILGGHISAQALLAASHTAPGRAPHSVHTYFLRPGDARSVVDFDVVDLQEGRMFSARRVTARQHGKILMEAMSSFKVVEPGSAGVIYQPPMPQAPAPEALPWAKTGYLDLAASSYFFVARTQGTIHQRSLIVTWCARCDDRRRAVRGDGAAGLLPADARRSSLV